MASKNKSLLVRHITEGADYAITNDAKFQIWTQLKRDERILVLSPHPDDETLGAGSLIAMARRQEIPMRVVFLTNGDGSFSTRLARNAYFMRQMFKNDKPGKHTNVYRAIASMRQDEATAALARLHLAKENILFLGYPDGGIRDMWKINRHASRPYRSPYTKTDHSPYANSWTPQASYCGERVLADLMEILIDFKPTVVITTHPKDTHPDHQAAHAFLRAAVTRLQSQQKYFSWADKIRCDTFVVHHGLWPAPHGYHPDDKLMPPASLLNTSAKWIVLPLDRKAQEAKAAALQCYRSQLIFTPQFLRSFLRRNEIFDQDECNKTEKATMEEA